MEAEAKQEVAELDRLIAAEEYKLSVLSGERPATPEYSRVRPPFAAFGNISLNEPHSLPAFLDLKRA